MEFQWIKRTAMVVIFLFVTYNKYTAAIEARVPRVSSLSWVQCADTDLQDMGVSCAFLNVPLDYDNPEGEQITLALTGIGAAPSVTYQGAMIVQGGDAGSSGLFDIGAFQYINNNAALGYMWIAFDPRGRSDSTPNLRCTDAYFDGPRADYVPSRKGIRDYWNYQSQQFARSCGSQYGSRLRYFSSLHTAKDIESIRVALDVPQVHLFGWGYSTYVFQLYATLYPANVGRMVLDSSVDPRRIGFAYVLDQSYHLDSNIQKWFDWIAQYSSVFNVGSTGCQVAEQWKFVRKVLAENPIDGELGAALWTEMFLEAAYSQDNWIPMAWAFSDLVNSGDSTALYDWGSLSNNYYAVHIANLCADARWPSKSTATAVTWSAFTQAPIFSWYNGWFYKPCEYWIGRGSTPVSVDGSGVGDILLISETLDAWNPYEGSLEVRRRFPGARLIAVTGGINNAHALYGNNCVDDPIAAYLTDGTLPARQPGDVADVECSPLPDPDPNARSTDQGTGKSVASFRGNRKRIDKKPETTTTEQA